jgi:hypothetical protein
MEIRPLGFFTVPRGSFQARLKGFPSLPSQRRGIITEPGLN